MNTRYLPRIARVFVAVLVALPLFHSMPVQAATVTPVEIIRSIANGPNDGFSGSWGYFNSLNWYEAGNPGLPYNSWFRFTGITIPKGATIVHAYLQTVQVSWTNRTSLKISAEKAASPTAPTSTANHEARVRTSAGVTWTSGFSDSAYHNSPDIASVIQELVNSYDYSVGRAIQILVDNSGSTSGAECTGRTFESGTPPRLNIIYQITPVTYALTMAAGPTVGGTATDVTNTSPYAAGSVVSIRATPNAGYQFVNWTATSGTFASATAANTTFTMPATAAAVTATFAAQSSTTEITRAIATATDDGFSGSWGYFNGLNWYEAGNPGSGYNAWFRFTGITIPPGAVIQEAHLELAQTQWSSGTRLIIRAEKAASPAAPTSTANHGARVRTTAGVAWTSGYADWAFHNSPNFAPVIQELVNSYSYSGGAIQILVDNNGSTSAEHVGRTYESGSIPRLYIKYSTAGPPLQYSLVVSTVGSGAIVKSPDQALYNSGTQVQLTAEPFSGWVFSGWSGNLTGTTNPASITVDSNKTVTATFTQNAAHAAKIVFTFDDGWADQGTYAFPIMQAAGFKGTVYVLRDAVVDDWPDMMNLSQVNELHNAGWDIGNHTTNHDDNGADTSPARLATLTTEYRENQEWILSNNWTRGAYHACYPSGAFSDQLITILKGMGVLTGRSVIDGLQAVPVTDFFRIPVQYVESGNVAVVEQFVDSAVQTGSTAVLMIHRVEPTAGDLVTTTADFQTIVNYVKSKSNSLTVMTMSEWYNSQTK
jgi:uncharacterized repeat protein (TIGR02543 family)